MLEKMLSYDEKILWRGKPRQLPYVMGALPLLLMGLVWGLFAYSFSRIFMSFPAGFGEDPFFSGFMALPLLPVFLVPFVLVVILPIWRFVHWYSVEYIITDRRVYLSSGIVGRDHVVILHTEIANLSVSVGLIEKLTGAGTIRLTPDVIAQDGKRVAGSAGLRLQSVAEPYEVFQLLRTLSLDVSSDMQFPNQYRPDTNPGYKTRYEKEDPEE